MALFVDEAHDLNGHTLIGLKRLIKVVEDAGGRRYRKSSGLIAQAAAKAHRSVTDEKASDTSAPEAFFERQIS